MRRFKLLRQLSVLVGIALFAVVSVSAGERRSDNAALFSESVFYDRVSYLASDELEGRGTGQEGIDLAAEFIASEFAEMGVQPGGDDNTYFQNFTLKLSKQISPGTRLRVGLDGGSPVRAATLREDYTVFPFSSSEEFEGEVVFAGYGLVSEDEDYNDYAGLDVADKVVLVLRRAPRFVEFSRSDMAFRTKAGRANARDAAALLIVNPTFDEEGDTLFEFGESALGGTGFSPGSYGLPMIHIRRELAEEMLRAGGLPDLATIEKQIDETERPMSALLEGVRVRGQVKIEPVESPAKNVVGVIPGQGPNADEYIVIGAHYDHLGIVKKGEDDFDPAKHVWNGADDNASGTALVMTLADAFAGGRPPNRSLLLILFTGEERGLLGSKHYVANPTVELDRVVAMLNFDMVGRLRNDTLDVGGMRTGGFEEAVRRLAEHHGLKVKDGGGGRGPSDHSSFYTKNIPVLFFFTGLHRQYHQPDDVVELLNIPGSIRIAKFVADVVDAIDGAAAAPQFAKDTRRPRLRRAADEEEPGDEARVAAADPGQQDPEREALTERIAALRNELQVAESRTEEIRSRLEASSPRSQEIREKLMTLKAIETELLMDYKNKQAIHDTLINTRPEDFPITLELQEQLDKNARLLRLQERVDDAEDALAAAEATGDGRKIAEARAVLERAGDRLLEVRAQKALEYQRRQIREAERAMLETRQMCFEINELIQEARVEQQDIAMRDKEYKAIQEARDATKSDVEKLTHQLEMLDSAPRLVDLVEAFSESFPDAKVDLEISIRFDPEKPETTFVLTLKHRSGSTAAADQAQAEELKKRIEVVAEFQRSMLGGGDRRERSKAGRRDRAARRPAAPERGTEPGPKDPHGALPDDMEMPSMPPVRMGIMPSYGEPEGEGYEITGVVEDGPAAKAGMRDDDRIYKIGDTLVTDVHSYMDALRKYKPGDEVEVTVIRAGKKLTLKVKVEGPAVKEAA